MIRADRLLTGFYSLACDNDGHFAMLNDGENLINKMFQLLRLSLQSFVECQRELDITIHRSMGFRCDVDLCDSCHFEYRRTFTGSGGRGCHTGRH